VCYLGSTVKGIMEKANDVVLATVSGVVMALFTQQASRVRWGGKE